MHRSHISLLKLILVIGTLLFPVVAGAQSSVVGEWDDNMGPWEHHIVIRKSGESYTRISTFGDGGTRRGNLRVIKTKPGHKQTFEDTTTGRGEIYSITGDGNLALYDRDGYIREAKRSR